MNNIFAKIKSWHFSMMYHIYDTDNLWLRYFKLIVYGYVIIGLPTMGICQLIGIIAEALR